MEPLSARQTALIIVDVQKAFDEWEAAGRCRNNPDALDRIADILADFRAKRAPVVHMRHVGLKPRGFAVKDEVREQSASR